MRLKNDTNNFAASFNITPPYQMRVIHSSKLIYPREIYQRGVQRKRVELIAADFNEYVANEPKISFRNGKYYVVDTLYRVSTIGQVEKDDIPMQKEACHEFAERQGWEIVKEFSEKGVSGFKKSAKERDQLQLLQQAAAAGEFDVLLVFMFDRLGRRDDETPFIVEWFTKQGVEVWSVNEGQQRFDSHVDMITSY